jgi:hypothetical protein
MNRKAFRLISRLPRCFALCASVLACSSPKDAELPKQAPANQEAQNQEPGATETNVTMPSMLANSGTGDYDKTSNDMTVCQRSGTFCDGFETAEAAQPPQLPWSVVQTNGSVLVDSARAFRGTQAVKATTLATAVSGATYKRALIGLSGAPVIPVEGNAFYGRMMFYLESAPQASLHWTFIDASGPILGQDYSSTYRYGGQKPILDGSTFKGSQFMANYDTNDFYGTPSRGPNTDCYKHADGTVVPVGKWSCAEWFFDGTNNQMKFWLDGTELTAIDIDGKGAGCTGADAKDVPDYPWTGPTISRIDMGWESYATDDERTIWVDDVVISPMQVGCPARAAAPISETPTGRY